MTKIILAFAGQMACGKGTATKYLVERYSASSYRFSSILRDILDRLYLEQSRENMQKLSTLLRENFSQDLFSKAIALDVKKDQNSIIALDGVRRFSDVEHLKKEISFKLVFIEADIEKKFERIIRRGENADDNQKTLEQFKKDHEGEAESQIDELKKFADYLVDNNGSLEDFYAQLDKIIKDLME